jgi:hypothetical protein
MPNPSIANVHYQVRIKWLQRGQEMVNVLHFKSHGSMDLIEDLLLPVLGCVTQHLLPVLSTQISLTGADVKSIDSSTLQEIQFTNPSPGFGAASGGDAPVGTSCVVALRTLHPGRTGRGRMFLPGIDEELLEGSTLDAAFITAAVAFLTCMAEAYWIGDPPAATQFVWMLRSKKDNAFYPITGYNVRSVASYLRSRKYAS